jgi:hypothetical protein
MRHEMISTRYPAALDLRVSLTGDLAVRIAVAALILSFGGLAFIGGTSVDARTAGLKSKPIEWRLLQPPPQQAVRLRYYGGPKSPMYP